MFKGFSFLIFFLILLPLSSSGTESSRISLLEKRIYELEKEVIKLKRILDLSYDYKEVTLFGRKIDLSKEDLRERFEREFYLFIERKGLLKILLKRYFKWKDLIEREIKAFSLDDDLIFLAIAESYLNPRVVSPAYASGLWQFVKETAKEEGLLVDESIDERFDILKATRAALSHIKKLKEEFGDIFLAVAAYNAGRKKVKEAIANQKTNDFFSLFLPEETERYVMRIAALKEILLNHEKYGIYLLVTELYRPLKITQIKVVLEKEVPAIMISEAMGLTYKHFRDINLHVKAQKLKEGTYFINVPEEKKDLFIKNLKAYPFIKAKEEP